MIKISRWYQEENDCVLGRLKIGDFHCFTLELPNLDNQARISCIPDGDYEYFIRQSPKNGKVLELKGVEGRTNIQIHAGNYTSQILGCILVGDSIRYLNNDSIPDVTNSRNTLVRLIREAGSSGIINIRG